MTCEAFVRQQRETAATAIPARSLAPCSPLAHILRNGAANLAVQVFQVTANLFVFLILARCLGKVLLGEYYTLWALIMVLQLLLEAGLGTVLTRRIAQEPGRWREIVAEAEGFFVVIVGLTVAVFLALGAGSALFRNDPLMLARYGAAGVACACLQIQRFCEGVFHALEQFGPGNLARALQGGWFVTLVVALAVGGWTSVQTAMLAFAASQAVAAGCLLAGLQRRWGCLRGQFHLARMRHWLAESIPLGLGDMLRGPNWHLDMILLGLLRPAASVGIYVVAYRPNAPLICLPRSVLTALFPSFARMAAGHPEALGRAFAGCIRLLWLAALPLVLSIWWFAEPIIAMLVGPQYLDAAPLMRVLIWKTALSFLAIPFRFLFTALGRQRIYGRLVLVVLAAEATFEVILILWLGPLGAGLGCVLGELILTAGCLIVSQRLGIRGIEWRALLGAAAAGVGMAGALAMTARLSFPLRILGLGLALVLYLALCLVFGALRGGSPERGRARDDRQ